MLDLEETTGELDLGNSEGDFVEAAVNTVTKIQF